MASAVDAGSLLRWRWGLGRGRCEVLIEGGAVSHACCCRWGDAPILWSQVADTKEHLSGFAAHQSSGTVPFTRHRGGGFVSSDYFMKFNEFNTFVADIRLQGNCFYYELQVIKIEEYPQFGVCMQGFEKCDNPQGQGTGDDAWSWAVDGHRQTKWHDGDKSAFGSKWAVGDIIGFALDMRTAGAAALSVSVNGSFAAPNGVAFTAIDAPYLSPSFTGSGRYRVNFGDRPFSYASRVAGYASVHQFHLQQLHRP
jgi:hypothetical protein